MDKSNFSFDLSQEQRLANFLDKYYLTIPLFQEKYTIERISNRDKQFQGIDLIITNKETNAQYFIDEKAQLNYINKKLPTFAFELTYLKNGERREGWLFDKKKKTDKYFVITCIKEEKKEFKSCRVVSVDRKKLIELIHEKISDKEIDYYLEEIRLKNKSGKIKIDQFNDKECFFYYSDKLNEKPINIVFYLKYLIDKGIGKEIFHCHL